MTFLEALENLSIGNGKFARRTYPDGDSMRLRVTEDGDLVFATSWPSGGMIKVIPDIYDILGDWEVI